MSSIFISHSSCDKVFVRRLTRRLRQAGVQVWLDEADLNIGDSLIQRIANAIDNAEYVAAVLSERSVESEWVRKELSLAMSKEIASKRVVVLPLKIDDCKLPDYLMDKLYADFSDRTCFDIAFLRLLKSLSGSADLNAIIASIAQSTSASFALFRTYSADSRKSPRLLESTARRMMTPDAVVHDPLATRRVKIFWHDDGLTRQDALHLVSFVADLGAEGIIAQHRNSSCPDSVFVSKEAPPELIREVIGCLPYAIKFIFPTVYPDAEAGALSEFVLSVGLHSTHRVGSRLDSEEPVAIDPHVIEQLVSSTVDDTTFHQRLLSIADSRLGLK